MEHGFIAPVFKPYWQEFKDSVLKSRKSGLKNSEKSSKKSGEQPDQKSHQILSKWSSLKSAIRSSVRSKNSSNFEPILTNETTILEQNIGLYHENSVLHNTVQEQKIVIMDLSQKLENREIQNCELEQRIQFLEDLLKTRPKLNSEYLKQEFFEKSCLHEIFDYDADSDTRLDQAFKTVENNILPRPPD